MKAAFFSIVIFFSFCNGLKRLCPPISEIQNFTDNVHIKCDISEGDQNSINFQKNGLSKASISTNFTVVEYNIDRNGYGGDGKRENGIGPIIDILKGEKGEVPIGDIIVLAEVARGCKNYGGVDFDGTSKIANSLGMNFAYVVEFIEIGQSSDVIECTIGNAILSKYPIIKTSQIRYESQCCRFGGRYGGRIAVVVTIEVVGKEVTIIGTHLESGQNVKDQIEAEYVRAHQLYESVKFAKDSKTTIISGDFNSILEDYDPVNMVLELNGYKDAHRCIPFTKRCTAPDDPKAKYDLCCFDYVFSKGYVESESPGLCRSEECTGYSDHVPLWTSVKL